MTKQGSPRSLDFLRRYGPLRTSARFEYVAVHPLADETDLLVRLDMQPSDCAVVDCYWALGDSVVFVSVQAAPKADTFASYRPGEVGSVEHYFFVSTKQFPLTGATYEAILEALETWYLANRSALPVQNVVFATDDLGVPRPRTEAPEDPDRE